MTERLLIDRLAHRGDGVADTPDGPVFVPYTLPGETVEAERVPGHPDRRHLLRVETPSPERIEPVCPHFGVCGGCAIQHWTEALYREWKRDLVVTALRQAGLDVPVGELIDAHGEGRRRAVFHARRGGRDVLEVGFAALRAHHIVGIDRCPVLARSLDGAIKAAWAVAEALAPERKPLDIQVTASEAGHRHGRARLRPAQCRADERAGEDRGRAPARAAHPAWRADRAAGDADGDNGKGADRSAAGIVPAGDRGRRTDACGARLRPCRQGQNRGRSVLRARTLRAQARGACPRHWPSMPTRARSPR